MKRLIHQQLVHWKNTPSRKPLILKGARQVGKTWILNEFGKNEFPQSHYFNFEKSPKLRKIFDEELSAHHLITELELFQNKRIDIQKDLIVLDEIQSCANAITSLKYFNEETPQLALCAAGSLIGLHLSEGSFPVGKVSFMEMYPLTFEEFLLALEQTRLHELLINHSFSSAFSITAHDKLWELWKSYLIVGGMPEVINAYIKKRTHPLDAFTTARITQGELILSYLSDMAKHSGKTNALHIEQLWRNIPHQLSTTQDGSSQKFKFKEAIIGLRGYHQLSSPLSWLENTGLILKTSIIKKPEKPLNAYAKENLFKEYFFDVGLLGSMCDLAPQTIWQYQFGSYKGYLAENYVAQEIRAATNKNLYCWMGRTSEVEFILDTPEALIPCEVKSGWVTQSKSLKVYIEKYNPPYSLILSGNNKTSSSKKINLPLYAIGSYLNSFPK